MVGQLTEVRSHPEMGAVECNIQGEASISIVQKVHQHNGYNYFDVGANLKLPDAPSSFIGMSGGGLWLIRLVKSKSGEISWDGKRYFRGVAFWESIQSDGHAIIRCHGPKSIYEKAWNAWGLPTGKSR